MFHFFLTSLLLSLSVFSPVICEELPEPYSSINLLPFDPHGWFGNASQLDQLIEKKANLQVVIEVGSWLGCSTRHIAAALPPGGKLYAVDTWAGSQNEPVHMRDSRLPYLYQLFLSNVIHAELCDVIVPVRMNSLEAAKALNLQADLIYLDAAHDTDSVLKDLTAWWPHLKPGGTLCGDDWSWGTVQAAVKMFSKQMNLKLHVEGNFWWYE